MEPEIVATCQRLCCSIGQSRIFCPCERVKITLSCETLVDSFVAINWGIETILNHRSERQVTKCPTEPSVIPVDFIFFSSGIENKSSCKTGGQNLVNPTCGFSLLTDMSNVISTGHFVSMTSYGELIYSCEKRNYRIWAKCIKCLRTGHQIGYRQSPPQVRQQTAGTKFIIHLRH